MYYGARYCNLLGTTLFDRIPFLEKKMKDVTGDPTANTEL
jgi:hypothetical protein